MSKQAEGGRARAERLSPEERTEIAKKGAAARWVTPTTGDAPPRETHTGELHVGDRTIECSVLQNGTRVLSQRALTRAMGNASYGGRYVPKDGDPASDSPVIGAARLPRFLESQAIKPFIPIDLMVLLENPIPYLNKRSGRQAFGYEATTLPRICSAILDARDAGALKAQQAMLAISADMLIRSLAQVGIISLIDEATGYQADRDKDELQRLLSVYLSEERLKWVSRFPREFFDHIFRLRGWIKPLDPNKRPRHMGNIINQIVYDQLPPGVIDELKKRNPVDYDTKRRKHKHHQFLSEEIGQPDLRDHIIQVLAIMRISDGWTDFHRHFIRAFNPKGGVQQELNFGDDD